MREALRNPFKQTLSFFSAEMATPPLGAPRNDNSRRASLGQALRAYDDSS